MTVHFHVQIEKQLQPRTESEQRGGWSVDGSALAPSEMTLFFPQLIASRGPSAQPYTRGPPPALRSTARQPPAPPAAVPSHPPTPPPFALEYYITPQATPLPHPLRLAMAIWLTRT